MKHIAQNPKTGATDDKFHYVECDDVKGWALVPVPPQDMEFWERMGVKGVCKPCKKRRGK